MLSRGRVSLFRIFVRESRDLQAFKFQVLNDAKLFAEVECLGKYSEVESCVALHAKFKLRSPPRRPGPTDFYRWILITLFVLLHLPEVQLSSGHSAQWLTGRLLA